MMRGYTLVLESATEHGSVALFRDRTLVAEERFTARDPATGARRDAIAPAVEACLARARVRASQLGQVVCGAGPGGFTSLRSAAAIAKGICSAMAIPLHAISSLELLVRGAAVGDGRYLAVLDAGRAEVFAALVAVQGAKVTVATPQLLPATARAAVAAEHGATLVGPHEAVAALPHAGAAMNALETLARRGPVSLETWEPCYGRLPEAQARWEHAHRRPLVP